MKTHILLTLLLAFTTLAATPEEEKAFIDSYKKAFESSDTKALDAMMLTEGVTAEIKEMLTGMQRIDMGKPVASIEMIAVTDADRARYGEVMEMPDGKKHKMPIPPAKLLVIKSTGGATTKVPVAEKDGKLVILLPVEAK
ncbi:MAG: hypothetical protein JNJ83_04520 [Verrucomicrobiaceae bacterium]|nr:hypothetical protein [Verrucomicrobiaceae bacterium]